MKRTFTLTCLLASTAFAASLPASAAPLTGVAALQPALSQVANDHVQNVQWRGRGFGYRGRWAGPAFVGGAIVGGAIAANRGYGYGYYNDYAYDRDYYAYNRYDRGRVWVRDRDRDCDD